jgi:hypothetical protein
MKDTHAARLAACMQARRTSSAGGCLCIAALSLRQWMCKNYTIIISPFERMLIAAEINPNIKKL